MRVLHSSYIWKIISSKKSIWVQWVKTYHIGKRNFWDIKVKSDACWSWRKILGVRRQVRNSFVTVIGDGCDTSTWFDNWLDIGPLSNLISRRHLMEAGFNGNECVYDIIEYGRWTWPDDWIDKFP